MTNNLVFIYIKIKNKGQRFEVEMVRAHVSLKVLEGRLWWDGTVVSGYAVLREEYTKCNASLWPETGYTDFTCKEKKRKYWKPKVWCSSKESGDRANRMRLNCYGFKTRGVQVQTFFSLVQQHAPKCGRNYSVFWSTAADCTAVAAVVTSSFLYSFKCSLK